MLDIYVPKTLLKQFYIAYLKKKKKKVEGDDAVSNKTDLVTEFSRYEYQKPWLCYMFI